MVLLVLKPETRRRDIFLLGLAVLVLSASFALNIEGDSVQLGGELLIPELCLVKQLTGLSCPSCGMTHSFLSMADGNHRTALTYNPVGPWLFLLVAFQVPFRTLRLTWGRFAQRTDGWDGRVHLVVMLFLVALLLVSWAVQTIRFGLG